MSSHSHSDEWPWENLDGYTAHPAISMDIHGSRTDDIHEIVVGLCYKQHKLS